MTALRHRVVNIGQSTVAISRELAVRYALTATERRVEQRVFLGMRWARRDVALEIWRKFLFAASEEELLHSYVGYQTTFKI